MPDLESNPTPNPSPASSSSTAPEPAKPKQNRSPINQAWIQELSDAGEVVRSALKPAYTPVFEKGDLPAAKLTVLAKDTLPAIDAAQIEEIQKALDEYKQVQTDQTSGQSDATTDRAKLEAAVNDIAVRRHEIQFAADDQWPHTNKANAGIRAEFKLPVDRAMQ